MYSISQCVSLFDLSFTGEVFLETLSREFAARHRNARFRFTTVVLHTRQYKYLFHF
jgi:hypothetical protein